MHILDGASTRVRSPIRDVTGQSRYVDEYLGAENGALRQDVGIKIGKLSRRLSNAPSLQQWMAVFGE